jgi:carboxypeptidase T
VVAKQIYKMKKLLLFFGVLCSTLSFSQQYSKVKIYANAEELVRLAAIGVPVDHGIYKENTFFISDYSAEEIQMMRDYNFDFEILVEDIQAEFLLLNENSEPETNRNATCSGGSGGGSGNNFYVSPTQPSNFNLGTMGGYLKYNEMLAELDAMAAQYPNLITIKAPISTYLTHENRPIYYVKISDNPSTDESAEPKVLYTAIHHAREPMSLMETIFYMWYLLENYDSNEEIQYLVNNTQMYFVPCINPDGYLRNETTNPNGGGMWRKNRRNNGGNVYGVDLNRNYSYGWGTTGTTTTNTSDDTYCGPAPFSEPETQAMRWLVQNNNFRTGFNAHTYGGDILFPVGTTVAEFADHHDYFQDESNHQVQFNGYTAMKSSGLYPASGDSDDYMYKVDIGVGQKDTIFVHTPEVGTAFWQPSGQIVATCQEMFFPNLVLAHLTRRYLIVTDTDPSNIATMSGNFNHDAYRLGLEDGPVTVSIQPLQNIQTVGSPVIHDINIRATEAGAISYTLNPSIQYGDPIIYVLETNNGLWIKRDTIYKTYGALTLQALENGSTANWTGNWSSTTSTFVSPSQSYTDSPTGNYSNNANRTYTYNPVIDLSNATDAAISYYAKWDIEADYDYCQFQVSTDGGTTWIGQCTNYTVPGTSANGSVQPNNLPVYEGVQTSWVLDEISLSDYLGQQIKVRFQLRADGGVNGDGFYFDDFRVMYNEAGTPTAPTANFSASSTSVCAGSSVTFNDFSSNIPTSWAWDFGDGNTSSMQNPTNTFAAQGTYTITLTVTNAAGSDTYTSQITVNALPSVAVSTSDLDNLVCSNEGSVTLTSNPTAAVFTGVGVSGNTFNPAVAGVGIHVITGTYTDGNGCQATDAVSIEVQNCAGIDELNSANIVVVPNPNNGEFIVNGLTAGDQIEVYDINGKLVYSQKANASLELINLPEIQNGVYYLRTISSEMISQVKFVKF